MPGGRWKKNALKKIEKNFLIYKDIQKGAVAKSYILTASTYMTKYLRISSYIRKIFLVNMTFQPLPYEFPYMRKILFYFFISVDGESKGEIIDCGIKKIQQKVGV